MRPNPLSKLPLRAVDFASACFSASVPRPSLRLVLVRVLASAADGAIDVNECRVVAMLFDSRHPVDRLCAAVRDAIRASGTASSAAHAMLFTRVSGALRPLDPAAATTRSVHDESMLVRGTLREALKIGGAQRAYERHCTLKSRVCVARARTVLEERAAKPNAAPVAFEDQYVHGLRRLGVLKPTTVIPEACTCAETAACGCFMARAMWRAGPTWLLLYAVLPPSADVLVPTTALPAWIERLVDANDSLASESEETSILADAYPRDWSAATPAAVLQQMGIVPVSLLGMIRNSTDALAVDASTSETSTDDASAHDAFMYRVSDALMSERMLCMTAVAWVCSRRSFRRDVLLFARCLGLYHRAAVEHVIAATRRHALIRHLLDTIIDATDVTDTLALGAASDASSAAHAVVNVSVLFSQQTNAWHAPRSTDKRMHVATRMGYSLMIGVAFVAVLHTFASSLRRVNEWRHYAAVGAMLDGVRHDVLRGETDEAFEV